MKNVVITSLLFPLMSTAQTSQNLIFVDEIAISLDMETPHNDKEILKIPTPQGKWAKIARELRKKNYLSGCGDYVLEQCREFRENFEFKHDR